MPSVVEWLYYSGKAKSVFWAGTGTLLVAGATEAVFTGRVPWTARVGWHMGSFGVRATYNMTVASARALGSTTLIRGGTMTVGGAAGSVALGYGIGAVVGTAISGAVWGKQGARDAIEFYTSPIDSTEKLISKFLD